MRYLSMPKVAIQGRTWLLRQGFGKAIRRDADKKNLKIVIIFDIQ
jgi:hypothetical protein